MWYFHDFFLLVNVMECIDFPGKRRAGVGVVARPREEVGAGTGRRAGGEARVRTKSAAAARNATAKNTMAKKLIAAAPVARSALDATKHAGAPCMLAFIHHSPYHIV